MTDAIDPEDDAPENNAATEHKESTFLVTHAESESAVLTDVHDGQVHTLSSNPDLEVNDVLEASIAPDPPLEVTHRVVDIESKRTIPIEESPEPPTGLECDLADDQAVGEVSREPRAGTGELHVLTVPEETRRRPSRT